MPIRHGITSAQKTAPPMHQEMVFSQETIDLLEPLGACVPELFQEHSDDPYRGSIVVSHRDHPRQLHRCSYQNQLMIGGVSYPADDFTCYRTTMASNLQYVAERFPRMATLESFQPCVETYQKSVDEYRARVREDHAREPCQQGQHPNGSQTLPPPGPLVLLRQDDSMTMIMVTPGTVAIKPVLAQHWGLII